MYIHDQTATDPTCYGFWIVRDKNLGMELDQTSSVNQTRGLGKDKILQEFVLYWDCNPKKTKFNPRKTEGLAKFCIV